MTTPATTNAVAGEPRLQALCKIEAFEGRYRYDSSCMEHMLAENPEAFSLFNAFAPMASHRKHAPLEAYHVARIAAFQQYDCGACLQLAIRKAREEGVPAEVVRQTLAGGAGLAEPLARVRRMVGAMASKSTETEELRDVIRADYGEPAWVEIAVCIAAAAVFPMIKKALGYFQSCEMVKDGM